MRNESYLGELVRPTSLLSVFGKHLFNYSTTLISNKKYYIFLLNCRDTPTVITFIVVIAIALLVRIAIAIKYNFRKSKSSNQLKQFNFKKSTIFIINHPVHFININIDNLERNTRKRKDTPEDKEEKISLIQNPVDNEQGNL